MAYLAFEANPDEEFDFFLAEQLKMTVADLGDMSAAEHLRWGIYFARKAQRRELAEKVAAGGVG